MPLNIQAFLHIYSLSVWQTSHFPRARLKLTISVMTSTISLGRVSQGHVCSLTALRSCVSSNAQPPCTEGHPCGFISPPTEKPKIQLWPARCPLVHWWGSACLACINLLSAERNSNNICPWFFFPTFSRHSDLFQLNNNPEKRRKHCFCQWEKCLTWYVWRGMLFVADWTPAKASRLFAQCASHQLVRPPQGLTGLPT